MGRLSPFGDHMFPTLFANPSPIDPDDAPVVEALERFGENKVPSSFPLCETDDPKVCLALALLDCHHPIVF